MWIFPTRSRLANCQRFIKAWHNTNASTPVYVRLDNDDPELTDLLKLDWPKEFEKVVGNRTRIGGAMQEMFKKYPNEEWYGMLADDLIPRTSHWDTNLIDKALSHFISYADDLHEKKIRICHPCVHGDLVRLVGFFGLPTVEHFGTDTVLEEIHHKFKLDGLVESVVLEHAHFNFGQSELDQTYKESQSMKELDKQAFRKWMAEEFDLIIEKINKHYGWLCE